MKPQTLKIESEALEDFRDNFNGALATLVREMQTRRLNEGTISAKLDIQIQSVPNEDGEIVRMLNITPAVDIKMGAKAKVECQKKLGLFCQMNEDGVPVVGSCQMDIDELLAEEH